VGDPRNKIRRQIDDRRIDEQMRAARARGDAAVRNLPRCRCGNRADQVVHMWQETGGPLDPQQFYCPACLPFRLWPLLLPDTINDPRAYDVE